ncbi:LADA_0B05754g1_1 [Lachancea dasiensis]|uniref:LADA_0B05754g1_1 n=1 Tax=Lachancea dasiensis TaxID=1072105 RepID=A0A1G4ITB2_9SACH|nr:LADA_0B05754g1_1 [Lachancea dasiensis]
MPLHDGLLTGPSMASADSTGSREPPTSQQYQEKFQNLYTRLINQSSSEDSSEDEAAGTNESSAKPPGGASPVEPVNAGPTAANAISAASLVNVKGENTDLSRQLHDLISSNSELGSRLLSLLLVSSGNAKEIIYAVNKGDLDGLKKLDLKNPQLEQQSKVTTRYTEQELNEFKKVELEKRRKNTEASARFRVRKKQRQHEKAEKLKQLNAQISELYGTIDKLLEENKFWKERLEEMNERKSREMLESIKKRRLVEEG